MSEITHMETAKDIDDLAAKIAEELQVCDKVYYDPQALSYNSVTQDWLWEYGDYLDMDDESFANLPEDELKDWERELIMATREALDLPEWISKPESIFSFKWMEEFTDNHRENERFFKDALYALRNRRPFAGFRVLSIIMV